MTVAIFPFFLFIFIFFVSGIEYYVDNTFQSASNKTGSKTDPFVLFDDAIRIFNNKSFLGNTIFLISQQNENYYSNETFIQIKDGSYIFFQK